MDEQNGGRPGVAAGLHDRATQVLSVAMIVIGVALVARLTALSAVLGVLFCAAGAGRLYVGGRIRRRRGEGGG